MRTVCGKKSELLNSGKISGQGKDLVAKTWKWVFPIKTRRSIPSLALKEESRMLSTINIFVNLGLICVFDNLTSIVTEMTQQKRFFEAGINYSSLYDQKIGWAYFSTVQKYSKHCVKTFAIKFLIKLFSNQFKSVPLMFLRNFRILLLLL